MTVVDLGAGHDPDPRADTTVDKHVDADIHADLEEKWPFADASVDGIILSHVLEHLVDPVHVFDEAARVLSSGGWLEITVPVGADARTDPTHEHVWTYGTPEAFCQRCQQPWHPDTEFRLVRRDLDVWLFTPFTFLDGVFNRVANRWPAEAERRCSSGELTAIYRRQEWSSLDRDQDD